MYAFRNLIRMPAKTVLLLIVNIAVLFLLMWSTFLSSLCQDTIHREIGNLNGSVKVCDSKGSGVPISLYRAEEFCRNFGIISSYAAVTETICTMYDTDSFTVSDAMYAQDQFSHSVIACTSMNAVELFYSGSISMYQGGMTAESDHQNTKCKVVVSKELADRNQWSIGDSLTLGFRNEFGTVSEQEFVIGGIFKYNDVFMNDAVYNYQIPANTVFIPLSTYRAVVHNEYLPLNQLYFQLKHNNEATVRKLESRLHEIGYNHIELKLYTPENVTAGIAKLLLLLQITSVIVVVCGLLVLFVIIFLNMQSRKKEIGILISLGKPAGNVMRSLFCEVFIVGILAAICAVILFIVTEGISETYIIGYLMSDAAASDFVNTTADAFFKNVMQQNSANVSASAVILPPILYAVGMCALVGVFAYGLIHTYMKNLQPMSIFGDDA